MGEENPNAGAAAGAAAGDNSAGAGNPGGSDPSKNGAGAGDAPASFDPSKLSDDDLAKLYDDPRLYKHERFKQLNERANKAKEYEAEKAKIEREQLEKKGEWEKIAKQNEEKLTALESQVKQSKIDSAIQAAASKKGIQDLDAALKLIDRSKVTVGDDGSITGVAEAVDALATERSYLLTVNRSTVGSPTNPGNPGGGSTKFKMSQLADPKFYRENEAAIKQAQLTGQIEEDRF